MNAQTRIDPALAPDVRPRSAVSGGVGLAGLAGLGLWAAVSRSYGFDAAGAALCALLACGIPMVLWSIFVDKVHRSPTTGIDWFGPARPLGQSIDISLAKIVGLWSTWSIIGGLYCIGRWYWDGAYLFAMHVLGFAAVPLLLISIP